ncbi:hypothetical protein PTSG_12618 [Salpingoeca rosetta]|uniref:Uncharacterized protein n=1 Tax=Salpingoeca rosetta (strain ATCC 50818 / BSB-021) TaxID=946362 RepID=F2UHG9_SALR5|nr:uncharacterized protein PTSG_12618 [Salpingoeca rosetta]EGD76568.1 hypothetical protein PTSG_12618 [Salpingoeca rosetta]|eukprot:XP_004991482.1 hypothetical protein PTSG_12618 [Salpingoeca rosetta]
MWWWKQSDKQREREREEKERQEKERQEKERQEKEEQERRERAKRKKEKRKKRAQQRRARREEKARQHYVLGGKWCPWQDDLLLLATQSDLHLFSIPEAPSRPQSPDFLEQQPGQRSRLEPGRSRWIGDVSDLSVLRPDELLRVKRIGGYVNSKPGPRCTFDWCPRKTEGRLVVANFGTATTFIKSLIEEETPGTAELSAALSVHNRGYCTSTEWNTLRDQIALGYSRDSRRSILVWDPRRYEAQLPDLARLRMATGTARQFTISSRTGRHRPVALQELGNGHGCRDTKWSPAKSHSLFAAMTNAVSVFDLRMGKEAYKWRMSDAERIAINPYDENMMAVARQGCIHVFDVRRWRSPAICEISASPGQAIVDLHFSPTRSDLLCFLETGSPWIHTANVFRSSMREIFAAPEKKHHTYAHDIGANFSALSCHPRHKARVAAIAREGFVTDTVLHPANVTIQSPNGYFLRTDENMFGFALSRAGSIGTEERFAGVDTQVTTVVPEEDMMVRRLLPRPKPLRGAGKTGKVIGDRPSGKDVEAPQAPNKALQRVYEYEKQFMRTYNADAPEEAYEQLLHRLLDMPIAEEEIFEDAATRRLMERLMVPLPRPPRRLLDGGDDDDDDDDESDEDDDDLLFEYDAADDTWVSQDDDVPVDFAIEMGDFDEEDNSYADTISSAFDSVRHGVAGGGGSIADRGDTRDNNDNNDDDGGDDDDDNDDDDGGGDDDDDDDDDDDYDDDDDDDDYDFDGEGSQPHGRRGAGGVRTKRRSKIFQPRPKSQAKVSFPPTDPAVRMSYIGARMYDRLVRGYSNSKQFMRTYNADAPEEAYEQLLHRLLDMPIAEEEIFEDAATRRLMERLMVPLPRPPRRLLDGGDDDDDDDDESDEDDDDLLFEYDAADDTWVSQDDDVPVDFAIEMGDFDEEDNSYADTISSAFDSVRHGVAGGGGSIADRGDTRDNNDNNDDDGGDDDDDNDDDDGGGDDDDDDDDDDDYDDDDDDDDYDFDGEGSQPHGRRGAGGVRTKRRSKIFQPRPKSQAKVSFPPTDPAVRMSYIGARMYDRLVRGYSNSARRNMKITCDDWEVHAVWEWLVAQERKGVMGKSAPVSIRDVLAANSQWLYRHAPGFVHPNATQVTMSTGQVLCDHAPQRLLSLALCGWFPPRGADRYSPAPINARLKELLQLGCIGRAASFLAFHNRLDHALIVLTSLEPKPCNDLFILCGTALQAASDEDIPAVAARMERVVKDPYLLAMLQLLADQQRACEAVTKNKEMHVADRAAFLLRFQDDTLALEAQLEAITNEMITGGFLHGLIFTGVSDASIELLQQFLDRTHDLQTVCLVAAHCIGRPPHILSGGRKKHVLTDDRTDEWFDEYRDLLDRWQMFSHRAEFDSLITKVVDTRSGAAPPRSVVLRCQHCNKCMAGARRLRTVRAVLKRNCQECHAPLQTCVVCATRMTINAVATGSFDVGSRHGREGQAPLAPAMFTWCQVCGHGGHANHLLQWFSANTTCAAAECNCKCIVNDTTTIQRQARQLWMALGLRVFGGVVCAMMVVAYATSGFVGEVSLIAGLAVLVTVLCLTGVAPPWLANLFARFIRFPREIIVWLQGGRPFNYNTITENVLLGRLPRSVADIRKLQEEHNAVAIVDMTQPWEQYVNVQAFVEEKIVRLNLPTPDYSCPSLSSIQLGVNFIEQHRQHGAVYVHCNGGKGRAPMVVAAWLVRHQQLTPEAAEATILANRRITPMSKWGPLRAHWRRLHEYYRSHTSLHAGTSR